MSPVPDLVSKKAWPFGAITPRLVINAALVVILALVPVYAALAGNAFALTLFTRIIILAIAALSLNLIMGFGGMVSFGHAAYLGIGGYDAEELAKLLLSPAAGFDSVRVLTTSRGKKDKKDDPTSARRRNGATTSRPTCPACRPG